MLKLSGILSALLVALTVPVLSRDTLLEFKAAYFLPTQSCVRNIYGNGGALYGPEVTFALCEDSNWYGFASADFFSKNGRSLGLCNPTKMNIAALALGVKYMLPYCYGDWYAGLGFQPVRLKTDNCSPYVVQITSKWGFGGIAKLGTYIDLPRNLFIDLFIDYSFVTVGCDRCANQTLPTKADISGAIFGLGLGYRFD